VTEPDRPSTTPAALGRLSAWQAGALVVASMVGTGVFTTSGFLLGDLGSPLAVLLVWLVGGLLALAGAAVYGELGAMMPRAGGEYVYLSRAFHPLVGFLSGWISLLVGFSAPIAGAAMAFGRYLHTVAPSVPEPAAGAALIVVVTTLHARDIVWAGRLQTFFTAVNLVAVVGFIVAGAVAGHPHGGALLHPTAALPSAGAFAVALVIVSYSYFGWNAAAYVAGEMRDPQRALPRALAVGCGMVTALYVALNAVFLRAVPADALKGKLEVGHLAAAALFGEAAAGALSVVICLVLAASVSALVMTGPRVYLAMAEDGLFFRAFARRNARGAPVYGVLLQGVLAMVMALTATFDGLLVYVGFTLSLSAAATVLGAAVLRWRRPELPRPYRTFGWPFTPLVFSAFSLWMAVYAISRQPVESLSGLGTVLIGALLYALWRQRTGRRHAP
jgi:APA family basic amino acid/polyamine antiporter